MIRAVSVRRLEFLSGVEGQPAEHEIESDDAEGKNILLAVELFHGL